MDKNLNIVSFDVPYPPNYGGVIDVFYKLKELHNFGVKIHLHTFEYGRGKHKELENICESVTYYKRNMSPFLFFSKTPFIVLSRKNKKLLQNIQKSNFPILFEGLHTTFYQKKVINKTYVRTHNIEHNFYYGLAKSETNFLKKIFFYSETKKLDPYEKILKKVDGVFSISKNEQVYFKKKYGNKSIYVPAFHDASFKKHKTIKGKYVLWHGDLRVSDNIKAALFLINVFKKSNFSLKIASSKENTSIINKIKKTKNIDFVNLKSDRDLGNLFENAHVNVLLTYQKTGIKLKLLNSLYKGKFIIANSNMIEDTGLEKLCELANTKDEILIKTKELFDHNFTSNIIGKRKLVLTDFDPKNSAKKIIETIFTL
ncbi:glycosyltransferase involved in cell wall biosynthesis [Tenacibaculum adriaticum]|uniref:Glycosyltransferase involved in cell wall biosynthesis n=1 Tax=Tenacibaculum adriaticum TaxID=413713 RepID=A0A5S5DPV3_9FLAO|nr:hypothetical protein [Tenacibaculum adriaticum]TYP97921.1 glycosyltransferase involved in cell wall biosynthesis [Tenacibaculum adriaticum]